MRYDNRIKDFLKKLQALSDSTGIYIEEFGDPFYNPSLEFRDEDVSERYCLTLNDDDIHENSTTYRVRKGNGYDGELVK